ncbi:hypothetical protein AVEN_238651-1 [Araneus ventricosus]|uniref:Uncharacterized protein n=1 Tax=Araneus ventricosus TaxID=182803 RepID=A0A4Y2KSK1_ARAVE|nr:hypothetical protein AVEN_238651-1 [Araneus ventricosus]
MNMCDEVFKPLLKKQQVSSYHRSGYYDYITKPLALSPSLTITPFHANSVVALQAIPLFSPSIWAGYSRAPVRTPQNLQLRGFSTVYLHTSPACSDFLSSERAPFISLPPRIYTAHISYL